MYAFGDESGNFRAVLGGDAEEVFTLGVLVGGQHECGGCAKRAVRRAKTMDEAKWTDMSRVQKRRAVECLNETDRNLRFGYIVCDQQRLTSLRYDYELYNEANIDVAADVAYISVGYSFILRDILAETEGVNFTFDQFYSPPQSNAIERLVDREVELRSIEYGSSHSVRGIQSADCIAGAVSETHRGGNDWEEAFSEERSHDCTEAFHTYLDRWLSEL